MLYNISMDMFVALSDPTRRAILEILASNGELSATAIYEYFSVSPQAISQHLKALREAKLVVMEKRAQKHLYRINQETLSQFEVWVQQTRQRWEERFSALDIVLEREKQKLARDEQESRLENTMGKVLFGLSVSLDGFIADKNDGVSEVFAWMGSAMEHFFEVAGEQLNETGAVIMGHRSFDQIYSEQGWVMPDGTPIPGPVIVLQSQAREPVKKGQTHFHFVTDGIESAIAKAKELAGEKNVGLHGASSVQQALQAGLLDELHMSIAHVLLGEGVRLFDHLDPSPIHLEHIRTLETPGATHLSFRVMK